jgi:hypothetical protein
LSKDERKLTTQITAPQTTRKKKFSVYILRCADSYYTGISDNPSRGIAQALSPIPCR